MTLRELKAALNKLDPKYLDQPVVLYAEGDAILDSVETYDEYLIRVEEVEPFTKGAYKRILVVTLS